MSNDKIMSIFAYIGILFLIPLLLAKDSKFARFHTNQGLVLFIFDLLSGVIIAVVSIVLGLIPGIGAILAGVVSGVIGLAILVFMILGIVNVVTDKTNELPIIGKIRILK